MGGTLDRQFFNCSQDIKTPVHLHTYVWMWTSDSSVDCETIAKIADAGSEKHGKKKNSE